MVVRLPILFVYKFSFFIIIIFVYYFAYVWPTALKLGCVTNFDMLSLVMGFISLVDEIQFMLISSHHICIRSMLPAKFSILHYHRYSHILKGETGV